VLVDHALPQEGHDHQAAAEDEGSGLEEEQGQGNLAARTSGEAPKGCEHGTGQARARGGLVEGSRAARPGRTSPVRPHEEQGDLGTGSGGHHPDDDGEDPQSRVGVIGGPGQLVGGDGDDRHDRGGDAVEH